MRLDVYDDMKNVILFGNGLNRLNRKNISWSDLLNSVMKDDGAGKTISSFPMYIFWD